MRSRVLCPRHFEKTPSAVIYDDNWHCFGCGEGGPLSDLGLKAATNSIQIVPEDIQDSIDWIKSLPTEKHRGFDLHADEQRYYLVWPDDKYYKSRRKDNASCSQKYLGPKGIRKPPYVIERTSHYQQFANTLMVVEGEFNALSIARAYPEIDIVSPGGVGDFSSGTIKRYFENEWDYSKILVIADADEPGKTALLELQYKLRAMDFDTQGLAMKEDANDILVKYGQTRLREELRSSLEKLS